jgi:hypothetical protein
VVTRLRHEAVPSHRIHSNISNETQSMDDVENPIL